MSNSSFTKVSSGGHVSDLNVSDLKVQALQLNDPLVENVGNVLRRVTYVGYAPSTWGTVAASGTAALLTSPGSTIDSTGSNALALPEHAYVESVAADNNGTALAPTTNTLGINLSASATTLASVQAVAAAVTAAAFNNDAGIGPAYASFVAAGQSAGDDLLMTSVYTNFPTLNATGTGLYPYVVNSGGAANTAGDVRVTFTLLVPEV